MVDLSIVMFQITNHIYYSYIPYSYYNYLYTTIVIYHSYIYS